MACEIWLQNIADFFINKRNLLAVVYVYLNVVIGFKMSFSLNKPENMNTLSKLILF